MLPYAREVKCWAIYAETHALLQDSGASQHRRIAAGAGGASLCAAIAAELNSCARLEHMPFVTRMQPFRLAAGPALPALRLLAGAGDERASFPHRRAEAQSRRDRPAQSRCRCASSCSRRARLSPTRIISSSRIRKKPFWVPICCRRPMTSCGRASDQDDGLCRCRKGRSLSAFRPRTAISTRRRGVWFRRSPLR